MQAERFEEMRAMLEERLKPSRYMHSLRVSQTAERLARIYGVDEGDAAVAGLLHDWDKALPQKELRKICKEHRLADKRVRREVPGVLHSLTAPLSLRKAFPEMTGAQLQAIGRHTCGAVDMSPLDMVVFVADMIEPGRDFPGVGDLREAVGGVCLDELFFRAYRSTLTYLIGAGQSVYPASLDVWNALVRERAARAEEACGACAYAACPLCGGCDVVN